MLQIRFQFGTDNGSNVTALRVCAIGVVEFLDSWPYAVVVVVEQEVVDVLDEEPSARFQECDNAFENGFPAWQVGWR